MRRPLHRTSDRSLRRLRIALAAGLALGLTSGAAQARMVEYQIDQTTAAIHFDTTVAKVVPIHGAFTHFSGHIRMDSDRPTAVRIDVLVDESMMTVPFDGARTLRSAPYFDAARFPTIRFESDSLQVLDANHVSIAGRLTIRGVSHPQVLRGTISHVVVQGVPSMHLIVQSALDRRDFGMVADRSLIADEVTLDIATTLRDP